MNALSVREDVLRASLLDELRHRLASDRGLAHARKRVAERLGELSREHGAELREHRARLVKSEGDISRLVDFITDGNGSKAVAERLKALESDADAQRKKLTAIETVSATPITLPTPDEMLGIVFDLERRLTADVTRGREELRRLFRDGRIDLIPQRDGFYIARSEILPLVLLTKTPTGPESGGREVSQYSAIGWAGAIWTLEHAVFVDFEVVLAA